MGNFGVYHYSWCPSANYQNKKENEYNFDESIHPELEFLVELLEYSLEEEEEIYCKKGNVLNTALWDFYNCNTQITKKMLINAFLNLKNNYWGKRQKIRLWNNSCLYLENHTKLSFIWNEMKDKLYCNWCSREDCDGIECELYGHYHCHICDKGYDELDGYDELCYNCEL